MHEPCADALEILRQADIRSGNWREQMPMLRGDGVSLRELVRSDGPTLLSMVTCPEVTRFIDPPPTTIGGFDKFIAWSLRQRVEGNGLTLAVVPDGYREGVGLIQLRTLDPGCFRTAEWGFAMGYEFWGSGLFQAAAEPLLDFAFDILGVYRLEARAAIENARGNRALRKLGAVSEGVLRGAFLRNGQVMDQVLWSILRPDWQGVHDTSDVSIH